MQTKKPSEKNTILKKKQKGRENERGKIYETKKLAYEKAEIKIRRKE